MDLRGDRGAVGTDQIDFRIELPVPPPADFVRENGRQMSATFSANSRPRSPPMFVRTSAAC
jgi:hypothetical protein